MKNTINFGIANNEDIDSMVNIEKEFFSDYSRAFDKDFMEKWYKYNPNMFYVVKDSNGKVLGFTILTPVTEELYNKLLLGEVSDMFDFNEEDVLKDLNSDYFYFSDICVSKENKNYIKTVGMLLGGMIKILSENATYVTTSPITKEGLRMCEHIGFKKVSEEIFEGKSYPIYELIITKEKKDKFSRISRLIK